MLRLTQGKARGPEQRRRNLISQFARETSKTLSIGLLLAASAALGRAERKVVSRRHFTLQNDGHVYLHFGVQKRDERRKVSMSPGTIPDASSAALAARLIDLAVNYALTLVPRATTY